MNCISIPSEKHVHEKYTPSPTEVQLTFCFSLAPDFQCCYSAPRDLHSPGSLLYLIPRFLSIMVSIIVYLFVLYGSFTSYRFTMRIEQLTKCCEPLQKLRVRLGPRKTRFKPPPPSPTQEVNLHKTESAIVLTA